MDLRLQGMEPVIVLPTMRPVWGRQRAMVCFGPSWAKPGEGRSYFPNFAGMASAKGDQAGSEFFG